MLKWTVKKRSDVQDLQQRSNLQQQIFEDQSCENRIYNPVHARRSLGNVLANQQLRNSVNSPLNELKYQKRRSLGSQFVNSNRTKFDKENHVTSTPKNKRISLNHNCNVSRVNTTPLNDCSNLQDKDSFSIKRKRVINAVTPKPSPKTSITNIYIDQPQTVVLAPTIYAPTLPSFDVEYSPHMKNNEHMLFYDNARYFGTPSTLTKPTTLLEELPAKRQKPNIQDLSYEFKPEPIKASSPLINNESTPLCNRQRQVNNLILNATNNSGTSSFNSSEVGDVTLEKMIDAILASAKHGKKFRKQSKLNNVNNNNKVLKNLNNPKPLPSIKDGIENLISPEKIKNAADRTIIIDDKAGQMNEREVKSPTKTDFEEVDDKTVDTCLLKRQKAVRRKNTSNENKNKKKNDDSKEKEPENCSTQKCLTFSPSNDEEFTDKFKRSSVSSNSSVSSGSSIQRFSKNVLMKGSLELNISLDETKRKLYVHVIKCKNLQRSPENTINAYVKCALVTNNGSQAHQNAYQRTAVHRNSSSPIFDHKFMFNLNDCGDFAKRIQLAVWHRNREQKRSEFLGCMSIAVENIIEKSLSGSFLLQPQTSLTNPSPIIPEIDEKLTIKEECENEDDLKESSPDDNLLRYLELDLQVTPSKQKGRTAFTLTKTMKRLPGGNFGFTITWMQPPKIEKVEPNSPAELSGLQAGDYIIFVGNCNIVTMSEMDILDLIVKQGENLTFEVFRSNVPTNSQFMIEQLALLSTPLSIKNTSRASTIKDFSSEKRPDQIDLGQTICETPKKRFNMPKIAFNDNIGKGVIV